MSAYRRCHRCWNLEPCCTCGEQAELEGDLDLAPYMRVYDDLAGQIVVTDVVTAGGYHSDVVTGPLTRESIERAMREAS